MDISLEVSRQLEDALRAVLSEKMGLEPERIKAMGCMTFSADLLLDNDTSVQFTLTLLGCLGGRWAIENSETSYTPV